MWGWLSEHWVLVLVLALAVWDRVAFGRAVSREVATLDKRLREVERISARFVSRE